MEVNVLEDPLYGVADNYDKPEEVPLVTITAEDGTDAAFASPPAAA